REAAETADEFRFPPPQETAGRQDPAQGCVQLTRVGPLPVEFPGGYTVERHVGFRTEALLDAAFRTDEERVHAGFAQVVCERQRRVHVPARSAGSEYDQGIPTPAHAVCSCRFCTCRQAEWMNPAAMLTLSRLFRP